MMNQSGNPTTWPYNTTPPKQQTSRTTTPTPPYPHKANPTVNFIDPPKPPSIILSRKAQRKIAGYVGFTSTEIGWMAFVEDNGDTIYIDDCVLLDQKANGATNELDPEALGRLAHEILSNDPEHGAERVSAMRCWGHSHHNMGTSPSGQDNQQMLEFAQGVDTRMVRIIANKHHNMRVDVWDYSRNIAFNDLPWRLEADTEDDWDALRNEINEKVQPFPAPAKTTQTVPSAYGGQGALFGQNFGAQNNQFKQHTNQFLPGAVQTATTIEDIPLTEDNNIVEDATHTATQMFNAKPKDIYLADGTIAPDIIDKILNQQNNNTGFDIDEDFVICSVNNNGTLTPFIGKYNGAETILMLPYSFPTNVPFGYDPQTQRLLDYAGSELEGHMGEPITLEDIVAAMNGNISQTNTA